MSNLSASVRLSNVVRNLIGTDEALAEALSRLRPALTKRAFVIVRNYDDVEDVVQESAVRAWDARARLRPGSDPAPWLNTIVTRVAIDFVRKERRRLAARQRRVLFMHDFMGFTAQEIARLDEVPYQTVRTRLRRARLSVRDHLQRTI